MVKVSFTIGDGSISGVTNRLNWPRAANVNRGTIPANMMVSGAAAQLRSFEVYASGITGLEIALPNRLSSAVPEDGQDLIASVENFDPAFVLEAGGRRLELPGPGVSGLVFRDPNERYFYNVGNTHGQQAFITAYLALTQVQRNATKLTITDEILLQPLVAKPSAGVPTATAKLKTPLGFSARPSAGIPRARAQLGGPLGFSARPSAGLPAAEARVLAPFSARPSAGVPEAVADLIKGFQALPSAGVPTARAQLGGPLGFSARPSAGVPEAEARVLAPFSARPSAGLPEAEARVLAPFSARPSAGLPEAEGDLSIPLSGFPQAGVPTATAKLKTPLDFSARPSAGIPTARAILANSLSARAFAGIPTARAQLGGPLGFSARARAGIPTALFSGETQVLPSPAPTPASGDLPALERQYQQLSRPDLAQVLRVIAGVG